MPIREGLPQPLSSLRLTLTDRFVERQPVFMAQSPATTDVEALLLVVLAVLALLGVYLTVF